jgi:tight adherence protein C
VPISIFLYAALVVGAVGLCFWSLRGLELDLGGRRRRTVRANLGPAAPNLRDVVLEQPLWERVGRPALTRCAALGRKVTPAGMLDTLERRRAYAGLASTWTLERLLAIKALAGIVGLGLGLLVFLPDPSPATLLVGGVLAAGGFFGIDVVMDRKAGARRQAIEHSFPNTIDQITISVEAGLGLDAAIAHAAHTGSGPLAAELDRVLQDIRAGLSRQDALEAFAERTDVRDIRNFVSAIGQANRYGVAIADALRVQAVESRERRKAAAEERAQKTTVKILFPLIFCILPALFIVVLGPAMLRIAGLDLGR